MTSSILSSRLPLRLWAGALLACHTLCLISCRGGFSCLSAFSCRAPASGTERWNTADWMAADDLMMCHHQSSNHPEPPACEKTDNVFSKINFSLWNQSESALGSEKVTHFLRSGCADTCIYLCLFHQGLDATSSFPSKNPAAPSSHIEVLAATACTALPQNEGSGF